MKTFCRLLKVLTFTICTFLFVLNTWMIFDSYDKKTTTIKVSYDTVTEYPSPTFVLCRKKRFISAKVTMLTLADFLNNTYSTSGMIKNVRFYPPGFKDLSFGEFQEWEFRTLYTLFKGQCLVIRYKDKVF